MDTLQQRLLEDIVHAALNGLHPLGTLTVTLAVVEEQIMGLLQGVVVKEKLLPSDDGGRAIMAEYYGMVTELLDQMRVHVTELHGIAQAQLTGAAATPGGADPQAQQEVTQLRRMFEQLDLGDRKPS